MRLPSASIKRTQHRRAARYGLLLVGLTAALAACTSDESSSASSDFIDQGAVVVVANSPGTVTTNGPQRVLVALIGSGGANQFLGSAEQPVTVEFLPPDQSEASLVTGGFLSTNGVALGLYVTSFDFDQPGQWTVSLAGDDAESTAGFVNVVSDSPVPEAGDPAPASVTLTAATAAELAAITTDAEPNPDFYSLSIHEAIANGRPTAIVFSTPAFCQTAICGPTVEMVKVVAAGHPEVDFVHVEPFELEQARAGSLVPIEAMLDWQLATEPWIFVVDGDGLVSASFEGIVGQDELDSALSAL